MERVTRNILDIFSRISAIPRQSKHEEQISRWLKDWAAGNRLDAVSDKAGNVLIRVPASPGRESAATVVLQGHMDMVCEKTPESGHDFSKDPIQLVYDGDWMTARDTTLGADNGIAIAIALTYAATPAVTHPPLELLFTVDEETGLTGANNLASDFISGRLLINLDSEEEGVFTIGCAGGRDAIITLSPKRGEIDTSASKRRIKIRGLAGGHSGVDIDKHRGNANKLLARVLGDVLDAADARIISISGGSVRNAIPRDAEAVIAVPAGATGQFEQKLRGISEIFAQEYGETEPHLEVVEEIAEEPAEGKRSEAYTSDFSKRVIDLLRVLPNGVREFSSQIPELVETSCNLATIREHKGRLEICLSQRSSVMSRLDEQTGVIDSAASLAGVSRRTENSYPAWTPDTGSWLLGKAKAAYRKTFSQEPKIEAIHAGVECAVIGAKYQGMDMISLGPTIVHPHSPDERIHIPSIDRVWKHLVTLLEGISNEEADK